MEAHYPNEKSRLLEMREDMNHVSYNVKQGRDEINSGGPMQEIARIADGPDEEYYEPEIVRKY